MDDDEFNKAYYVPIEIRKQEQVSQAILILEPPDEQPEKPAQQPESLLRQTVRMQNDPNYDPTESQQEGTISTHIDRNAPLITVQERAKGISYVEPMTSDWNPPPEYQELPETERDKIRKHFLIDIDGHQIPPPILAFNHMRLPHSILEIVEYKLKIRHPTAIQIQAMPCLLAGRDMIGVASTGSGKTLAFVIPMLIRAIEGEMRLPLTKNEGPIGLVICPSRELAIQTINIVRCFTQDMKPIIKSTLLIGGSALAEQCAQLEAGTHVMVATPGRLKDLLARRKMHLRQCIYLVLDEADRLVNLGFEDEVRQILDYLAHQRQTLLFSATMPRKIQEFATSALVSPIICKVGRPGAANVNVEQRVEYVKQIARLPYLVACIKNTPPPVVVFCENKRDVDDVDEYLVKHGIDAVSIHGGRTQRDRNEALSAFKSGARDVLVASDVASKGLDFPNINHVINYDMPREIENYVHRIGRTGRRGHFGISTTFIDRHAEKSTLLDLRALLQEANQIIPTFLDLMVGYDARIAVSSVGCSYCGGLGHTIADCSKLHFQQSKPQSGVSRINDKWQPG